MVTQVGLTAYELCKGENILIRVATENIDKTSLTTHSTKN